MLGRSPTTIPTSTTPIATSPRQSSASTTPSTASSFSATSSSTTSSSTATSSSTSTSFTSSTSVPQTVLSTTPAAAGHFVRYLTSPTNIVISTGTITFATPSTADSSGSVNTAAVVGGIDGCLTGLAMLGSLIMCAANASLMKTNGTLQPLNVSLLSLWTILNHAFTSVHQTSRRTGIPCPQHPTQLSQLLQWLQTAYGDTLHAQMAMLHAPREDHSHLTRRPSSTAYLPRQLSAAGYLIPNNPQAHYVNLDRSSATPLQPPNIPIYAVSWRKKPMLRMTLLPRAPSPVTFDPFTAASTTSVPEPVPAACRRDIANAQQPDTAYTMYEEGDAYGGI
ncbi:uncharacterized protein BJ212DRAFT_1475377 [Suillus subaureus]|uniref:Uncharacterized protein n=1 Tax=Suillus subaureus TaxID=48587 RepID=A0A9P7EMB5_9AGAM|nr:uncharacterized protein BJ212DRAFT_1475377 [Suillus subaureus]KAG1826026.1 hypothetical protein BJ212DRAFT_1475377 [Suillus subaureus]